LEFDPFERVTFWGDAEREAAVIAEADFGEYGGVLGAAGLGGPGGAVEESERSVVGLEVVGAAGTDDGVFYELVRFREEGS
jgi:hypothetical protein